jgi:hypothetical protein
MNIDSDKEDLINLFTNNNETNIIILLQKVIKYIKRYNKMDISFFEVMNNNIDSIDIIKKIYHILLIKGYFVSSVSDFINSYIKYINEMLIKLQIIVCEDFINLIVSYLLPIKQYEINSIEFQNKIIKAHTRYDFFSYHCISVFEYIFYTFLNPDTIKNYIYYQNEEGKIASLLHRIQYSHIIYPPHFLKKIFTYLDSINFDYNNPLYYSFYDMAIDDADIDMIKLLLERKITFERLFDEKEEILFIIDRRFSLYERIDLKYSKNKDLYIEINNNDLLLKMIFKFYYENQSKLTMEMRTLLNEKYKTSFFTYINPENIYFYEENYVDYVDYVDYVYSKINIKNIIKYVEVFELLKENNFDFTKYRDYYIESTLDAKPNKIKGFNKYLRILYPEIHERILNVMS